MSTGTATVNVTAKGAIPVSVSLAPVQAGTGTLSYAIALPDSPAAAGLTIESVSGETAIRMIKNLLASGAAAGSQSLPAGKYRLTVKLSDGAGKYARWTGAAHIWHLLETTASCSLAADPFSESFFADLAALSSWLGGADANSAAAPYRISLDLPESAITAIPAAAGTYASHADADKIAALILPQGLETIGAYGQGERI